MRRFLLFTLVLGSHLASGCSCAPAMAPDGGTSDVALSDAGPLDTFASDVPADAGADAPEVPSCGTDCWRWESPTPDASIRWGLWASATDDAWAVGQSGLAHWDGASWAASGPAVSLRGVWGASASDIWAVGPDGALHFDGTTWTAVAGAPTGLQSVWGAAPNDVWAAGSDGVIARWNGAVWSRVSSGTTQPIRGLWGLGPNDVWALGGDHFGAALLHWDGATWTPSPLAAGPLPGAMDDAWGASSDDVWATGDHGLYHWDGARWSLSLPFGIGLRAVWGRAADDVWAVGPDGFVLHWDGATWTHVVPSTGSALSTLYDVTGVDDAIWAVGYDGTIVRWNGSTFAPENGWTRTDLRSGWASSESDVWAVGGGAVGHFDGARWTAVEDAALATDRMMGVWGSSANDVWIVGHHAMSHWDGSGWTSQSVGGEWNAVWGSGANDVWAVGGHTMRGGVIAHWDGATWTHVPTITVAGLNGVGGTSASDVWATGNGGTILHFDGTTWTRIESGTATDLGGVWASAPGDAWIAADSDILHWDGEVWSVVPDALSEPGGYVRDVFAREPDDVWAVGNDTILHYDGERWTQRTALGADLSAIFGVEHLIAVGARGAIITTLPPSRE